MTTVVDKISKENMKEDGLAPFGVGDLVKVHSKVREGEKERIQIFAGTVIAREGGGSSETFTVRRVSHGVGVEKVFPIHAPSVTKVEIERSSHVRRAKLYYLRDRSGKGARLREKIRK
jgi:large subunit ribosomal protein L19